MSRPVLVTSEAAALHVRRAHDIPCRPATVRSWAKRGHIKVHRGSGIDRYDVYDVHEIEAYLIRRKRVAR